MKIAEDRKRYGRFAGRELATLTNEELHEVAALGERHAEDEFMMRKSPRARSYKKPPAGRASDYAMGRSYGWYPTIQQTKKKQPERKSSREEGESCA